MSLAKVFWEFGMSCYSINLGVSNKSSSNSILTFDTGAGSTIFGIDVLINEKVSTIIDKDVINNMIVISRAKPSYFSTATKEEIAAYPCCIFNVDLGGLKLDKLYFYLTFADSSISLLGNDFINYCGLEKSLRGDIEITSFDFNNYELNFVNNIKGDVIFPVNRIFEKVKMLEETRNIACAYDYIMRHK